MANKTSNEKCGTQLKREKVQESQTKLGLKLKLDLERDLLRLFQESLYCDIKLTVDSSSVLTHSCILQTRACRFYKYIYSEFHVFQQNGLSIINIYNASFTHLQSFVENIYTNIHTSKSEDFIIKHLQETKTLSSKQAPSNGGLFKSAITPESDLFFTPKCSPTELQKPFAPSKLNLKGNNVASYYKIVSVDDIPIDEKLDGNNINTEKEEELLEKELAEQDELLSSFNSIFSKKAKSKPNFLSLGKSSQSTQKPKLKSNRKFESNVLLFDDHQRKKFKLPLWKPNPTSETQIRRDKHSGLEFGKKKYQERFCLETNLEENSLCGSDMDVSTTGGDSGLDNNSIYQQETSPRENTVSETSGVDLTEATLNEDIPNDETISTKRSTGSSVSSEVGTWEGSDEAKTKSTFPANEDDPVNNHLNEEEILRLDEMDKNIRDCEIFIYMERQGCLREESRDELNHSSTKGRDVRSFDEPSKKEETYQYANEENETNKSEELLQGETNHHLNNNEEENYYRYNFSNDRNAVDAITSQEDISDVNLTSENYEDLTNESSKQGTSGDVISNSKFYAQSDIQETKTPPCTPKKVKLEKPEGNEKEEPYSDVKSNNWEYNNPRGVSNYFIDASSLLDEDEIYSPPVSLINFKSVQNCEETESKNEPGVQQQPDESSRQVVSNFYTSEPIDDTVSYLKEQERRQGDIIFKNSIPHFSKHEVGGSQVLENEERLRGGSDRYISDSVDDESEQVVPSADIGDIQPIDEISKPNPPESTCGTESNFFVSTTPSEVTVESPEESEMYPDENKDVLGEPQIIPSSRESVVEVSSSSGCSGSPSLRRRNESAPILSGGMDFVEEEKKVQRKPFQSQSEAWVVTFDDNKKPRSRITSSDKSFDGESGKENGIDSRSPSLNKSSHTEGRQSRKTEPSVEFYIKEQNNGKVQDDFKLEPKVNPVEKSSSFGYFFDFGNEPEVAVEEKPTQPAEKKNIFSMFIGMDENSKPTFSRKPKQLEKENTFDKSSEENQPEPVESSDNKKSFYMFIESDSSNVKRKPLLKRPVENSSRKTYLRTQSYTIERHPDDHSKPEVKTDFECSSSDNSLPYVENNNKPNRLSRGKLPMSKVRSSTQEPKMTAWGETKVPNENNPSSESWLRTKDIQVNYTGKSDENRDEVYLKKDSTFVKDDVFKRTHDEKYKNFKHLEKTRPTKRDLGVIPNNKSDDSFVKLSDLDNSSKVRTVQAKDAMSQSISEDNKRKSMTAIEAPLSKSTGSKGVTGLNDRQVSQSLTRLFSNMNPQSGGSKKESDKGETERSDFQASETSEISSSMQSSFEPTGLEISTSETDVSTHLGTTSRLEEDLLKMFLQEIGPDVVVEVGGRRIKAHKCILSSRCQYFAAMLSGGWVESAGNVISLQGFDPECYETTEERDILSDTKTKFVPPKYLCASSKTRRKSRTTFKPTTFEKVYAQLLDRRKKRRLRRIHMKHLRDMERKIRKVESEGGENRNLASYRKMSGKSRLREEVSKEHKKYRKRKDPWYLSANVGKTPDGSKTYRQLDDDVDHEKQPLGEGEEGEQINMGPNYESWLLLRNPNSGEREVFHAFWKGEGNLKSIRKAQTKMMLSFMDPSVDPCQDFYQFACGNWGHKNPIPKDKAGYDTFEMLRESLDIVLQDLLMEEDNDTVNEATLKTKNLFRSCMNNKILEERREKPLLVLLESLGGWPMIDPNWKAENFDWIVLMAKLRLYNNDILISEWVGPDIKNSDEYIIQFDQTSLGLPTREYFLEPCNFVYLEAYKNYLIKISTLLGSSLENAKAEAEDLMIFETALAEITSSPDERRNVSELYERMTVSELSETVPEINWIKYLTIVLNREVDPQEPVVMFALRYVQDLVKLLCQTEPRVVSNYLLWRFIRHRVNNLDDRFQEAKQHFYYILFGREEAPPRWKNCVAQVNTNMGMGLGAMFVARYFDEKSKNDTLEMTHDIMRSFREILNHTVWIDNETKRLAIQKVDAMMLRIGYPDFILNRDALNERYAEVNIDPQLYFENTLNILKHLTRAEQDRLGTRVNKSLWNTPPAVVNAYYSRNKNQIMFPAGILQPPFYHRYFPRSLNYGGIGVVIGHEITHGFDDKGRLFDQDGNLHKWWKEPAIEAFHERAQCLIDQYSKYTVTEVAMQIDGVNTQGENIADNGGIKQAFKAYERWLSIHGDKDEVLQGINATNLQLFFLNFAQIWCGTMRPEATRNKLKTAVHSPGKFRVIGTLSNSEDFARVFQCEPGSPMNPIKKCSVWFSYNSVHFALRHIYSGESVIPESLNIVELATLADMLCLDGLQEIISYNLKVKYCHSFHVPCSVCSVGVLDCLPITAAYGLDNLYRKCLRWINKYFVKIWPTKSFGSLPKELLEKCYQHYVVHMTVDNVLDTIVNIDKVRGSLPNVRWAEPVSRLVNKLHDATVRYIAEHLSSVLTSDSFLALGKEAGWNVSRLEDSLIETIRYLPPEQACWSHARLHRILSVATGPDPPPEMDWNENFLKLLQLIAELVENSLIKQAPRAAKSKAWRQMEPELRSRIQEAACLVLPDQETSPVYRRTNHVKKEVHQPHIPQTAKSRNLEIRQIKLAMSQLANRNPPTSRPLSLQIDQRPKKDSRFVPLRPSVSTSSVRKPEPTEGIRKTQSRSQILVSEPKKVTTNPRYSEVKSRYLEPRSPQKTLSDKPSTTTTTTTQKRTFRHISSSDSSRNCSPALRPSNSRSSIPQAKRSTAGSNRQSQNYVLRSESASTLDSKRDRSFVSTKSDTPSVKTLSRLTGEENMSTDSLCTDSLSSEKEATLKRRSGKENLGERRKLGNATTVTKSTNSSPVSRRHNTENWSSSTANATQGKKLIISRPTSESKANPPKRFTTGKIPVGNQLKLNASSPRTTVNRNQRNSVKTDTNLVNGNLSRKRNEVDSENNRNSKEVTMQPSGLSRSGTFLKDEPTILKKPQVENEV